jgi:hypothetical protein
MDLHNVDVYWDVQMIGTVGGFEETGVMFPV